MMYVNNGPNSMWKAFQDSAHVILLLSVGIPFADGMGGDSDDDSDNDDIRGGPAGDSDGLNAMSTATVEPPPPDPMCLVHFIIVREGRSVLDAPVAGLPLRAVLAHYVTPEADFQHGIGLEQPDFTPEPKPPAPPQMYIPFAEDLLEHRPRAWQGGDARGPRQWRNHLSWSDAGVAESRATIAGVEMYRVVAPGRSGQCQVASFICDITLLGVLRARSSAPVVAKLPTA